MLPHHIVTAVTILGINLGHALDRACPAVIGGASFTGRITNGEVTFSVQSLVLAPSQAPSVLLHWLDLVLPAEHATITAYDLAEITTLLGTLPDADWSPALRILSDCGHQPVIDTVLYGADHRAVPFAQAAMSAGIPCVTADPGDDFNAWMTGRQAMLAERLEADAIASWRLAMARIAERSALGRRVNASIEQHLGDWLRRHPSPAAILHLNSLARTNG